jgi:hypothetical protein
MNLAELREAIRVHGGQCELIESLSEEKLDWLVANPPLGDDLLDHALICASCAAKIARAVRTATLSEPAQNPTR